MKVWIFYLTDKKIIKSLDDRGLLQTLTPEEVDDEKSLLYAYTNDKKLAKAFVKTRNMKMFYTKCIDVDKDEYNAIDSRFYSFNKLMIGDLLYNIKDKLSLPLTTSEFWYCSEAKCETFTELLEGLDYIDYKIFNPEYISVLEALLYCDNCIFVRDNDEYFGTMSSEAADLKRNMVPSEFGLFCYLYGQLTQLDVLVGGIKHE